MTVPRGAGDGRLPRSARSRALLTAVLCCVVALVATLTAIEPLHAHAAHPAPRRTDSGGGGTRPNIVELLVDDMRVSDLAYMPNLRRIAGEGLTMRNAFSPYPLCCPARASFFSGLLPHNHRVFNVHKPYAYPAYDDSVSLATSLKQKGYLTGFTGKYLNGYGEGARVLPRRGRVLTRTAQGWRLRPAHARVINSGLKVPAGWDDWRALVYGGAQRDPVTGRKAHGGGTYDFFHTVQNINGRILATHPGTYTSAITGSDASAMIRRFDRRADAKPFFVSANFVAPHIGKGDRAERLRDRRAGLTTPSTASPRWAHGMFDRVITKADGVLNGSSGGRGETETGGDLSDKPGSFGRKGWTRQDSRNALHLTRQRAEAMFATDRWIGQISRTLEQTGEARNTVFVFWSDNGYLLGEHSWNNTKVLQYNPSMRVPMIFAGPGVRQGVSDDPATVVDLTTTLLDLAGATAPWGTTDGRSLRTTLTSGDQGWRYAVPYEQAVQLPTGVPGDPAPGHATAAARPLPLVRDYPAFVSTKHADGRLSQGVRTSRYAYVRYANGFEELYDEASDPLEMENVADAASYRSVKKQLLAAADAVYGCRGASCQYRLPQDLAVTATENTTGTRRLWDAQAGAYGNTAQRSYWRTLPGG